MEIVPVPVRSLFYAPHQGYGGAVRDIVSFISLFLIFTFTKRGSLITPLTNRDHSYPSLHFAYHGGDTHGAVCLKTYCIIRTDFHAVETSHTPGIVNVPAHHLYALRTAYLLALHAVDAFIGIDLDMIECVIAEASQCRPYRAYHGAESAPRQQGEDHEQQQGRLSLQ